MLRESWGGRYWYGPLSGSVVSVPWVALGEEGCTRGRGVGPPRCVFSGLRLRGARLQRSAGPFV